MGKPERSKSLSVKFTKRSVAALRPQGAKRTVWHDSKCTGLCVRIEPTGSKCFAWFRKVDGRGTWKRIGAFPDLSIENARTRAQEFNSQFARWKADDYQGNNPFEKRKDLTIGAVLDDYIERHLKSDAKNPDRAIRGIRWQFEKYMSPWRNRKLSSIHEEHVLKLYQDTKSIGFFTANRLIQMLRALFNWATAHMKWHGGNPARIKLTSEKPHRRRRFLQADEAGRFFRALSHEPSRDLKDFIVLALCSGARMSDVLSMRWDCVNIGASSWLVPNPKSSVPYLVGLFPEAVNVLKERQGNGSPWVFPGTGRSGHITGFKHSWVAFLKRADITGLRVHDLRRTLGSWMAMGGASLPIIGRALGHQSLGGVEPYAQLQSQPVDQARDGAIRALLTAGGKPTET